MVSLISILPFIVWRKISLRTQKPFWQILRALTGTGAWYFLYESIHLTSLTIGSLLTFSSPLLIPFISHFVLKQRVRPAVWFAIFIAFFGIVLVLNPFQQPKHVLNIGLAFGIAGAILMTITQFVLRILRETENTFTILFYYLLVSVLMFLPPVLLDWKIPSLHVCVLLVVIGLLMSSSQFLITYAYRFASAVHLGTFVYTTIIFSALIDAVFFETQITVLVYIGIALVVLGGILVVRWGQVRKQ